MEELKKIENYILYLITYCNLSVTLHPMERDTLITFSDLMKFNIHDNPYCSRVKSHKCGYDRCLLQQRRVFERVSNSGMPIAGVCHAGVFEYVYPIRDTVGIVGFISVGGYASDRACEYIPRVAGELGYLEDELVKGYKKLKTEIDDQGWVDAVIQPLCDMFELAYTKESPSMNRSNEDLLVKIKGYVQKNYSADLKIEDICRIFGCSRSFITHNFKRECGMGFHEYLVGVRIENATGLLEFSRLNVTEIAISVGFSESNYFSNAFKERVGMSPLNYRKIKKAQKTEKAL